MKNDALLYFKTPSECISYIYELDIYNGWKIQSGLMNERGRKVSSRPYFVTLRKTFDSRDFFRQKVSMAEIVSWLDTMTIVQRLLASLQSEFSKTEYDSIEIFCEYMIQMSKKMRIDYVFKYQNRLLLLEFRTVSRFNKIRPTWQTKIQELMVYKELMSYYLPHMEMKLYAFIAMYEYDQNTVLVKHRQYNDNQVAYLTEYIKRYLIQKN